MRISLRKIMTGLIAISLLAVGAAQASSSPANLSTGYLPERASSLLVQIQTEAAALRPTSDTLATFAWNPELSWPTHASYLSDVKGHINMVGKHLDELQQIRGSLPSWQQEAVKRITSHATRVAASTEIAIEKLRADQDRFFVPEYRDHLTTIADASQDMHETVSKFVNYDRAQREFQLLQNDLELAAD